MNIWWIYVYYFFSLEQWRYFGCLKCLYLNIHIIRVLSFQSIVLLLHREFKKKKEFPIIYINQSVQLQLLCLYISLSRVFYFGIRSLPSIRVWLMEFELDIGSFKSVCRVVMAPYYFAFRLLGLINSISCS